MDPLSLIVIALLVINGVLLVVFRVRREDFNRIDAQLVLVAKGIERVDHQVANEFSSARQERDGQAASLRREMLESHHLFKREVLDATLANSGQLRESFSSLTEGLTTAFKSFQSELRNNNEMLSASLKERLQTMETLQNQLIATTERKIGEQTARVEEKLGVQLKGFEESSLQNRGELTKALEVFGTGTSAQMATIKNDVAGRLVELTQQNKEDTAASRSELMINFTVFKEQMTGTLAQIEKTISEKLLGVEARQKELVASTEKKLEEVRVTVDEKLTKTLHDRISQSFTTVVDHLTQVQQGLGDMKNLANDVGGLKKVLSNVKTRGTLGETQLAMLLEQVLSPEQFQANVRTKRGSNDAVEFAIKLPGKGDNDDSVVYLPIDAKFPKDVYETLIDAYDRAVPGEIEVASKGFEAAIKKMAKDIHEKYIDPPHTTDFALMFLPFEGIYAEAIRRTALIESLQSDLKIAVAGPSTLGAYLNSLQMGFRTLALQKRSSEVWSILGAVKTEFENFGGLLEKAQKSLHTATNHIDELAGTRTRAIKRKLKDVQSLPAAESRNLIPDMETP